MTEFVRNDLRDLIDKATTAHPGLLLQRGWVTDAANAEKDGKTKHIERICNLPATSFYNNAFERWLSATADTTRFVHSSMKIEGRLLIGLTGGGALETGCAVSQTYGVPYLPGSSIKGAVRAWAEKSLPGEEDVRREIFGIEPNKEYPTGLSGSIVFHDAWWIPASGIGSNKDKPFAEDVVTTHHSDYYGSEGKSEATDLDSPIPNAIIGVRGSFLFSIEGDHRWTSLARILLEKALTDNGIGAKTAAGYGYLKPDPDTLQSWIDKISRKSAEQNYAPALLSRNVGTGEIKAILSDSKKMTAPVKGTAALKLLENLPEEMRNGKKIKEGKLQVEITVRVEGNMLVLLDLRSCAS